MESEERPVKRRRLSNEDNGSEKVIKHEPTDLDTNGRDSLSGAAPEIKNEDIKSETTSEPASEHIKQEECTTETIPPPIETAPLATALVQDPNQPPLSKNQRKKLARKAEWEAKRDERKVFRKEKLTAKRERRREERALNPPPPPPPKPRPQRAVTLPVTILIDCAFDDLMRDPERISLASQITRCYSDNKHALFRAHLALCSFGGSLKERFENILVHYKGWKGVRFLDEGFVEAAEAARGWMVGEGGGVMKGAFEGSAAEDEDEDGMERLRAKGEVVYLTSEAEAVLGELKPFSTYIIGGLVDKNREKGICYKRATAAGVKTARLPIGEFMDMQSRKVLTTNHVNEIMIRWLECKDWGQAFLKVIPKRKGGTLKGDEGQNGIANAEPEDKLGLEQSDEFAVDGVGVGEDKVNGAETKDGVTV